MVRVKRPEWAASHERKTMSAEARVKELGLEISKAPAPVANYVPAVTAGKLVFLSGQGPRRPDGSFLTGKVGKDLDVDQAYQAARMVAVALLSALKGEIGSLDRVKRVVKLLGMVNGTPEFADHPKVINGASDLLVEVFGDKGKHARSAVGMGSLPMGIPVEVEMIVEVE